jgi:hypothetical protein
MDAMLVCALATRAAQLAADDGAASASSSSSYAAFVQDLSRAALERAPSSRPQQFAQVTVSVARLVEQQAMAASTAGGSGDGDEEEEPSATPSAKTSSAWLDSYLAAAEVHLPNFSDRRLCQLAWAAAKLRIAAGERRQLTQHEPASLPLLPSGERWWAALLSEAQDRLPAMRDGRDWSNLLWALARLGVAVPPGWSDDALAALTSAATPATATATLALMRPRERATVLWSLARMGVVIPPGWIARELAPALLARPSLEERLQEAARRREAAARRKSGGAHDQDNSYSVDEPESSRDVAASLWALARWQQLGPWPDVTASAAAAAAARPSGALLVGALAARAADALEREEQQQQTTIEEHHNSSINASLVVSLMSLARLVPAALDPSQAQRWLSLARRAMPSLSGRGLARLAAAVRRLRLRPPPEWMRALQVRVLQLTAAAPRVRAGELAEVLRLFASVRWSPGAGWWAALLASRGVEQLTRAAPARELAALLEACRATLGVGAVALAGRRRRRRSVAEAAAGPDGSGGGLLAAVVLGARHAPAVARWTRMLWERVGAEGADGEGGGDAAAAVLLKRMVGAAEALAPRRMALAGAPS